MNSLLIFFPFDSPASDLKLPTFELTPLMITLVILVRMIIKVTSYVSFHFVEIRFPFSSLIQLIEGNYKIKFTSSKTLERIKI